MIRVGELQSSGARASLRTRLTAMSPRGFEIDLVIVAYSGESPAEAGLLSGSPGLLQRMYYREQRERIDEMAFLALAAEGEGVSAAEDQAGFARLVPSPAFLDQFDTLEELVAEGETLFV